MAMKQVQFQRGLSIAEFMQRFGSDAACEATPIQPRWPQGFICPDCGCGVDSAFRREGRLDRQCSACRHQYSVISGTIFASSTLGPSRWFLAMHRLIQSKNNIRALELRRYLGVCHRTAWMVKHRLIKVVRLREDRRQLTGRVGIDDAYLGGSARVGSCQTQQMAAPRQWHR